MPLNTLRLNHAPSSHPNDRIVFIKPLTRPSDSASQAAYKTADLVLRAIAAQCLPIMKQHHLSVTTLEEHEPNKEFIGRNFNNGEVIQLVLQSFDGRWLSVGAIQMVMMHELAHNLHMNHGRDFWKARNLFAEDMRKLWAIGYTGDGLWGSGRVTGDLDAGMGGAGGRGVVRSEELKDLPVCGGTFRSRPRGGKRNRKRKIKSEGEELSRREKKERRIEKKFGKNGSTLGEDEEKRLMLEGLGKGPLGVKPRVAQSKRGRELRAAAALARFASNKREHKNIPPKPEDDVKHEHGEATDSESENNMDDDNDTDDENSKGPGENAHDRHGNLILDKNGQGMVRVCGDEDVDDIQVKQELDELEDLDWHSLKQSNHVAQLKSTNNGSKSSKAAPEPQSTRTTRQQNRIHPKHETEQDTTNNSTSLAEIPEYKPASSSKNKKQQHMPQEPAKKLSSTQSRPSSSTPTSNPTPTSKPVSCPICTALNPPFPVSHSSTCITCAHVLYPSKDPNHWRCRSRICAPSADALTSTSSYINAGDCGICGICGERKP